MAFISLPLKKTWDVEFSQPLRKFINSNFRNVKDEDYSKGLKDLDILRRQVITKWNDKHESSLEILYRYFDQLKALDGKFPIAENGIRINFKWQDAFDKESLFSGKKVLTIASSSYEQACLLFNIASLQSQIAASQNFSSDDGLKIATKFFQQSAGILNFLKNNVTSMIQREPTTDLSFDCLQAMLQLMLAQAQDAIAIKATIGRMKPSNLSKICMQTSDLYTESMKFLQHSGVKDIWPKDWLSIVSGKQAGYNAMAEFYQSSVAKEKRDYGEELGRLRRAKDMMVISQQRSGTNSFFSTENQSLQKALKDAEKDNDFIYHAKILTEKDLPNIDRALLAKIIQFDLNEKLSSNFTDLFGKIQPIAILEAQHVYENKRAALVNQEISKLREATNVLNGLLASMNLPAALDDAGGSDIPPSLLKNAEDIRKNGGINSLRNQLSELPKLLNRNSDLLNESIRMLDEEQNSDLQLKEKFKERWTRTSSAELTVSLRNEAAKFKTLINNAMEADKTVREKLQSYEKSIEILSLPDNVIAKQLPSGGSSAFRNSPAINDIRQLCSAVETIKAERQVIENELKDDKSNIVDIFVKSLTENGTIDAETISSSHLESLYSELCRQAADSITKQTKIIDDLQRFYASVGSSSGNSRETMLKDLTNAYNYFMDLGSNLKEGTTFYNDLTQVLVNFQNKVSDYCFARKTEKEDLIPDLQRAIINTPTSDKGSPNPPNYQHQNYSENTVEKSSSNLAKERPPVLPPRPSEPLKLIPRVSVKDVRSNNVPPSAPSQQNFPQYGSTPGQYGQNPYNFPNIQMPMPPGYNPYMMPMGQQPQQNVPYPYQQYNYQPR